MRTSEAAVVPVVLDGVVGVVGAEQF